MQGYHTSVLLDEAVDGLLVKKGKKYIDATLGGGGHTLEIARRGGTVLGVDTDDFAIGYVSERLEQEKTSGQKYDITLAKGNFKTLEEIAKKHGFDDVAGILFDLGVSSYQFDTAERGFSFLRDSTLDMRMDRELSVTAKDLINGLTRLELSELFAKLGEERFARKIADAIVREREKQEIVTTGALAKIIRHTVPGGTKGVHPATRVFQALRIAVNDELNVLREALPQAITLLAPGGRLAVISFHSLEDRIVKQAYQLFAAEGLGEIITKKPFIPTPEEITANPRSRSAKLRVFEKI